MGDDAGPAIQVREPSEDAVCTDHDVELAVEDVRKVIYVGADEIGFDRELRSEGAGLRDRILRKIDSRYACPESCPGERVHAEMALEMKERAATHIAHLLPLQ